VCAFARLGRDERDAIVDLRDYWLTIRRRWMLIVACLMATVGAAAIYTWQATPQYASTAQLFVSTTPSDVSDVFVSR
jgi:uncharacterized protein involved in exopolysaccharide biosynthesis